jgi:hypothetical protein
MLSAQQAKGCVRQLLAVVKISFKRIARIKPIVVYDHDQSILPPRCQLILNGADKLRCWPLILGAMQDTHARQPRNIFRHDIRSLLANRKFRYGQDDLIRRACLL